MPCPNPFDLRHQRPGPTGDLVEKFLSGYESRLTRQGYRSDLTQVFGEEGATRAKVAQVQEEDVVEHLRDASSLARATLERRVEALKSFFRWLLAQGLIEERPIGKSQQTTDLVDRALQETGGDADPEDDAEQEGDADPEGDTNEESASDGNGESGRTHRNERSDKKSARHTSISNASQQPNEGGGHRQDQSRNTGAGSDSKSDSLSRAGASDGGAGDSDGGDSPSSSENFQSRRKSEGKDKSEAEDGAREEDPESDGDPFGIPRWASEGAGKDVGTLHLDAGEHVPLGRLPSVLHSALSEIADSEKLFDPTRLSLRYDHSLSVQICFYEERGLIEIRIQNDVLYQIIEGDAASIPHSAIPYRALVYLNVRGWALPSELYDQLALLSGSARLESPPSEDCPIWTLESAHQPAGWLQVSREITGAFANGFQIGRDEELYVRKRS